jgi:hypothetical protein
MGRFAITFIFNNDFRVHLPSASLHARVVNEYFLVRELILQEERTFFAALDYW